MITILHQFSKKKAFQQILVLGFQPVSPETAAFGKHSLTLTYIAALSLIALIHAKTIVLKTGTA